ncbi:MAG: RluA family pseudouridine synthase [Oligosphaeraceae bacterium]
MASPALCRRIACELAASEAGQTLVAFLARRFTYRDASGWRAECESGRLLLDGRPAGADDLLPAGGRLEYVPPPLEEPPVDFGVTLLWRGEDCAVLAKPANLPCHPAGRFFNHTLWALLRCGLVPGLPAQESIHFASRLDRETSGLVLVGWTPAAARRLAEALSAPGATKEYRVLVEGRCPESFAARGWLYSQPGSLVRRRRLFTEGTPPDGAQRIESAGTVFRRLGEGGGVTELSATLETGRTHQIRATLASLGLPVVGDKLYGPDEAMFLRFIDGALTAEDLRRLRLPRQALHAWRLTADLDGTGRPRTLTAPCPWTLADNGPELIT